MTNAPPSTACRSPPNCIASSKSRCCPAPASTQPRFWTGFDAIVHDLAPKNAALLAERDRLQAELDAWHTAHPGPISDMPAYRAFLRADRLPGAGAGAACRRRRTNVDAELALQAGPQLVVPITNARYALNAANARWGSLYDALYGTDAIAEDRRRRASGNGYNPVRGAKVIAYARHVLDRTRAAGERLARRLPPAMRVEGRRSWSSTLQRRQRHRRWPTPAQFVGYQGDAARAVVRCCWRTTACTSTSASTAARRSARPTRPASTTWCSKRRCRPSWTWRTRSPRSTPTTRCWPIATGSASCKGTLTEEVSQGRQDLHARPQPRPRLHRARRRRAVTLHGRSLLFVRNVGHLMTNPAILWGATASEIPEGILDAVVTTADRAARPAAPRRRRHPQLAHRLGLHRQAQDARPGRGGLRQRAVRAASSSCWACPTAPSSSASWTRSAAPASTSRPASPRPPSRVAFINTGFLDRTGDEMHTAMQAGPMMRKGDMKTQRLDRRPTSATTCWSAWPAACAARRRSARACGPCPT